MFSKVKDMFKGSTSAKKKKLFHNVRMDDPEEYWEIVGELGDGAYGKVYKAQHKQKGIYAALKQVTLEADDDLETFMVEIDILAEFRHPNVVRLLEAYHRDGKLWMYLEYCDGGAVDSIMVDLDRPLNEAQIAHICQNLCNALKYIHENKVIHRDLKAGNVLLTMDGGVKLADFGVSAKNKNSYDKRGTFIGTPYWLAPEVILCETFIDAKYDYKADIWSLGITLIEFAQLDPPHHEVSPMRVMLKIQKSEPPKLENPSSWSREFNDFIAHCLIKDPNYRPSASELLKHPFVNRSLNVKPIRDLLLEYKAEVVEEEVDEDPEDTNKLRTSLDSDLSCVISSVDDASNSTLADKRVMGAIKEEERVSKAVINERHEVTSNEKRISKGPAPPPPTSTPHTPTSPVGGTPSKKGPAPAVPGGGRSSPVKSKSASPEPPAKEEIISSPIIPCPTSFPLNVFSTSTPAGKNHAPMSLEESPVSGDNAFKRKKEPQEKSRRPRSAEGSRLEVEKSKKGRESWHPSGQVDWKEGAELQVKQSMEVSLETLNKGNTNMPKSHERSFIQAVDSTQHSDSSQPPAPKSPSPRSTTPLSPSPRSATSRSPSPRSTTPQSPSPRSTTPQSPSPRSTTPLSLSPRSATSQSPGPQSQSPRTPMSPQSPAENMVTFTVPALREFDPHTSHRDPSPERPSHQTFIEDISVDSAYDRDPLIDISGLITLAPPSLFASSVTPLPSPSLSEAEEQAVRFLDSAIDSAILDSLLEPATDDVCDANISDSDELDEEVMQMPPPVFFQKDDTVTEVEVTGSVCDNILVGHKLDESEVVISNSSILRGDNYADLEEPSRCRYELTLEEDVEDVPLLPIVPEQISPCDKTHVSVVSVDDCLDANQKELDLSMESLVKPDKTVNSVRVSNLEDALTEDSVKIEGTTVGCTDVDEEVFDHRHGQSDSNHSGMVDTSPPLSNFDSLEGPVLPSTPPVLPHLDEKIIVQNGVHKEMNRLSDKSDSDSISNASSDKENRHKQDSHRDATPDPVVLRKSMKPTDSPVLKVNNLLSVAGAKEEDSAETIALRKKTRKRTRKFVVDGVTVTTTTSRVIYGDDDEPLNMAQCHMDRKQELRELKILQRVEQKQFQELAIKANMARAEQEKKFDVEKVQMLRNFDSEVELLNRQQKQQVEKAESQQEVELKSSSRKIRYEQERDLKSFRDTLKTEQKLLKQEIDLLPKDKRKESFRMQKERLDCDQMERERTFVEKLHETHETSLKRMSDEHHERIALLERQFLQQKHQLLRSRESSIWELEERQLHEKHQLIKRQLKDIFFLQRHQMLIRHEKELEQVKRMNCQREEELVKRQNLERRQLPKRIRQEMKAREMMFRESMRISTLQLNGDPHNDEKERLRKFQEGEKRRYEAEKRRADQKHQRQLEELQSVLDASTKELEQMQNEKRKILMEHETHKLKNQDEEYHKELRDWKNNLKPRKQSLEQEFEKQLTEQEQFYGTYLSRGSVSGSSAASSVSSASVSRSRKGS